MNADLRAAPMTYEERSGIPLECEERGYLRALLDEAKRAELTRVYYRACAGCGCAPENRTIGCKPCQDRHNRRRRRENAEYRAREQAVQRAYRRRRRAAASS